MARSLLDQLTQIDKSETYNDGIVEGLADNVTNIDSLEGDLNALRSRLKATSGAANWYDDPDVTLNALCGKQFLYLQRRDGDYNAVSPNEGFDNAPSGTTGFTDNFDAAIKALDTAAGYAFGAGNSTTEGVVLYATRPHKLILRRSDNGNAIDDGNNGEVYGRLIDNAGDYRVEFYREDDTTYTFSSSINIDLGYVVVSEDLCDLPWDRFLDIEWHDTVGSSGNIDDANVTTGPFTDLLAGLGTQELVNAKVDDLGSTANGEGASLLAIEDASAYYTSTNIEGALNELEAQIGGLTSGTYAFTEDNVLADNDAIYAALNKLDLKWGDLASTADNEGAHLVGVHDEPWVTDSALDLANPTNVQEALVALNNAIEDVEVEKITEGPVGPFSGLRALPGGATYTSVGTGNGALHMDVYDDGQLLFEGALADYQEAAAGSATQITWNYTVKSNSNITYMIRK
jgi:hypothetical protein